MSLKMLREAERFIERGCFVLNGATLVLVVGNSDFARLREKPAVTSRVRHEINPRHRDLTQPPEPLQVVSNTVHTQNLSAMGSIGIPIKLLNEAQVQTLLPIYFDLFCSRGSLVHGGQNANALFQLLGSRRHSRDHVRSGLPGKAPGRFVSSPYIPRP